MVSETLIDQAVGRVLRFKILAGIFKDRKQPSLSIVHAEAHRKLAHRASEESITLLKNEGNLLPLNKDKLKTLALIGPNSNQVQFGDYCWSKSNQHGVSILKGIKELVGDCVEIHHAKGCSLIGLSKEEIPVAADLAAKCDVAIVVIGDTSSVNGGIGWEDTSIPSMGTVGETYDVSDPVPPGVQLDLVKAIHATGTPTIVIMLNGRPYSVPWVKKHIPVVIKAFYPGEMQGTAMADILFGNLSPSGRLPVSIAQTAGHIPTVYDYKPSGRGSYGRPGSPENPGRDYVFSNPDALWPFGHGLSYAEFEYSGLKLAESSILPDGLLSFEVTVKNTGTISSKEVVQAYFNDKFSSSTTPVKRLAAFKKVDLEPGQSKILTFHVNAEEFGLWSSKMEFVVEPGEFELMVGRSSEDIRLRESFCVVSQSFLK